MSSVRTESIREIVLAAVGDPESRAILGFISETPRTVTEIHEALGIPRSTLYRKLDDLTTTPLVEVSQRVRANGNHPTQYNATIGHIQLRLDETNDPQIEVTVCSPELDE